jgi:hypothetical protein
MNAFDTYNTNVKSYTPDWLNNAGSTAKGGVRGAMAGMPFGPIGMAAGGILGAVGSGLNALWQNKEAKRQNDFMAQQFNWQKQQAEKDRQERKRGTNINTIAMLRSNLRDAMYGNMTGRF